MAARKVDWSTMRGTVIGFAVCVVLAGAMLAASMYFKDKMAREYRDNHARFRAASQQYLAVDEEERIIDEFYPEFVRLYRAGLLGRERRLSWLETLREAGASIKMPELSYKLEAQREAAPDYDVVLGGYRLYASPMNLNLGLLHEGDLLRLFDALDRDAMGQYTVRECEFVMSGGDVVLEADAPNISAQCELDWLTVDLEGERALSL